MYSSMLKFFIISFLVNLKKTSIFNLGYINQLGSSKIDWIVHLKVHLFLVKYFDIPTTYIKTMLLANEMHVNKLKDTYTVYIYI